MTPIPDAYIYDARAQPARPRQGRWQPARGDLAAPVGRGAERAARPDQPGHAQVEDVIWGCVTPVAEQGGDIARSAVLYAGWDERTPGLQINRFCASGLEAVNLAANQVRGGAGDLYVAGGVEMMSRVKMGSDGFAIAVDPYLAMKSYFVPQGIGADLIATRYGFSRDDVDAYAVESQRRAARAWDEGRFARSVVTVKDQNGMPILDRDEHMRPGTDMQSLGALKASFKELGETMPGFDAVSILRYPDVERINHVHHAGNSSGIVDGAAAVLVGSQRGRRAAGPDAARPGARDLARSGASPRSC